MSKMFKREQLQRIEVYYTIISEANWLTPEWLRFFLDEDEIRTYQRYRVAHKKSEFLIGRALLKTILAKLLQVEVGEIKLLPDEYGKLYLASHSAQFAFNLSHSNQVVACVVASEGKIGIDVEKVEKNLLEVAERFFAPGEIQYLKEASPLEQRELIYKLWTLKEAYIKAEGKGLSIPLESFNVLELSGVSLKTFQPVANYILSIAAIGQSNPDEQVVLYQVELDEQLKIKIIGQV